jgi:hypothetical protein
MKRKIILSIVLVALLNVCAYGQDALTPATVPTTTRARREAVIPQGFNKIQVEGRVALVEQADEPWVRERLGAMKPTSRPSTVTDMLNRVKQRKDQLVKECASDMALPEQTVSTAYDQHVITPLQQMEDLRPPIFYMVTNTERLKELLKSGWQDPNFYYNRAADAVVMSGAVGVRTDGPMDDSVIPAVYSKDAAADAKTKALTEAVASTENDYNKFMDERAKAMVGAGFATLVHELGVKDLNLKDDQRWYGLGIDVMLASKYSAPITDQPDLVKSMAMDNPRNPLRFTAVDLLHPPAIENMNPEAMPFYVDTVRRKSTAVIQKLTDAAGPGAIAKTLTAYRAEKPADGPALVKMIQAQAGIDLTNDLTH